MAMPFSERNYNTQKQILMFPDHYVAFTYKLSQNSALATETPEGRKIVKAGTFFPANDDTAVGIVLNDYDVTDGDQMAAIVCHGFVKTAALPEAATPEAEKALSMIQFFPLKTTDISLRSIAAVGEDGAVIYVSVAGTRFKDGLALTDLVIEAGDTGLTASRVEVEDNGRVAAITFTGTVAAGILTVQVKASGVVNGKISDETDITFA